MIVVLSDDDDGSEVKLSLDAVKLFGLLLVRLLPKSTIEGLPLEFSGKALSITLSRKSWSNEIYGTTTVPCEFVSI